MSLLDKKVIAVGICALAISVLVLGVVFFQRDRVRTDAREPAGVDLAPARPDGSVPTNHRTPGFARSGGSTSESERIEFSEPATQIKTSETSDAKLIDWETLYKLDYRTGAAPEEVAGLNGSKVRIPGFIVPLSDDLQKLGEFLLVPSRQACIHVPPPPPNLIVHVFMKRPVPIERVFNPSWLEGVLKIETTKSEYGFASYRMDADRMQKYDWW